MASRQFDEEFLGLAAAGWRVCTPSDIVKYLEDSVREVTAMSGADKRTAAAILRRMAESIDDPHTSSAIFSAYAFHAATQSHVSVAPPTTDEANAEYSAAKLALLSAIPAVPHVLCLPPTNGSILGRHLEKQLMYTFGYALFAPIIPTSDAVPGKHGAASKVFSLRGSFGLPTSTAAAHTPCTLLLPLDFRPTRCSVQCTAGYGTHAMQEHINFERYFVNQDEEAKTPESTRLLEMIHEKVAPFFANIHKNTEISTLQALVAKVCANIVARYTFTQLRGLCTPQGSVLIQSQTHNTHDGSHTSNGISTHTGVDNNIGAAVASALMRYAATETTAKSYGKLHSPHATAVELRVYDPDGVIILSCTS